MRGEGWTGAGKLSTRGEGYYNWKFEDGKTGRTTFTFHGGQQRLWGHVVGSGLDGRYVARRRNPFK